MFPGIFAKCPGAVHTLHGRSFGLSSPEMRDGVSDEEEVRVCFAHDAARGFMPGCPVVNHEVPVLGAGNQRGGYGPGGRRSGHDEGFRGCNAALSPEQAEANARAGRGLHRSQIAALRAEHAGRARIHVHSDDGFRRSVHRGKYQFSRLIQGGADSGGWG